MPQSKTMTNYSEILTSKGIKIGTVIETYYRNGSNYGQSTVTRISDYFVFVTTGKNHEHRESHGSVLRYLKLGLWRLS